MTTLVEPGGVVPIEAKREVVGVAVEDEVVLGDYEYARWTLTELLRTNLQERPERPAIRSVEETISYREVFDAAARMASGLRDAGVGRGDRVLLMMDNSAEWAISFAALSFLGAVSVPTNTMYRGSILTHVVRDSGAKAAVVDAVHLETLTRFDDSLLDLLVVRGEAQEDASYQDRQLVSFASLRSYATSIEPVEVHPWDPACVGYTSGTTGNSKGVVMAHAHLVYASDPFSIQEVTLGADEVIYVVVPLFHILGIGAVVGSWILGAHTYVEPRFSASTFITDATAVGATHTYLVAAMAEFLMQQPVRDTDVECSISTAYLNPVHSRHWEFTARFGIELRSSFGSTEVGGLIVTGSDIEAIDRRSCGKPRPGVTVRLVDAHDIEVPVGEPGECITRHVYPWTLCSSYLGNPEATAAGWRNGWFHTGDLLTRDADGYYYFVDRKKDAIRRRGENVSSLEVEREVMAHDEIFECAVVAVDLAEFEQEIKVYAVRAPDSVITEADLTYFLIDRLPRYAVPRFIEFVDEMPRTPTAKVRKHELRGRSNDLAWDREAAGIVVPR